MTGEVNETRPNVPVSAARRARRVAVLGFVRDRGVTTQTELCTALDINPATAMRIIGDLIAEGFVEHVGFVKSAGGRPRARLRFVGTRHAIIGVEASGAGFTGAVTDLDGLIQTEMSATAAKTGPENLALLVQLIADLMAVARPEGQTIVGIGVGVPSIVKKPEGEVVLTLGLDWHELPLQEILSRHFGLHVIVENDRNLAALGEWGFGIARGVQSVVSLAIGPGAGAGIVIDGELVRGRSNASGEISWFLDDPGLAGRRFPRLGDKNQLRYSGIVDDVIEKLGLLGAKYADGTLTLSELFTADPAAPFDDVLELLDFATMAAASISAILNPEMIVLNGGIVKGGDLVMDVLHQRLDGNIYDMPTLALTQLGSRDIVYGAIRIVLDATVLKSA